MSIARIDAVSKVCSSCKTDKPLSEYHKDKSTPLGVTYSCKACATQRSRTWHRSNLGNLAYKSSRKNSNLKRKYDITLEQWDDLFEQQGGECAICKCQLDPLSPNTHTDHCHLTGKIRGILCTNCNRGLGHFQDNIEFLTRAISYLGDE